FTSLLSTRNRLGGPTLKFTPIQKQRVSHLIIQQIRSSVEAGEIGAGDRLPSERDLAESLAVSRSAVREAFSVLEASGLIKITPGVGVFLTDASGQQLLLARLTDLVTGQRDQIDIVHVIEAR